MARFPSVGQTFGGYRITGQLGRGGMGVVFAAEQLGLGRPVALKVLAPELAEQGDYRARFQREASVLAKLDSPHVVQIYDHGEQDGCLFIATQYVGGGDLAQALHRHGPMPVAQAATLAAQLAWALSDSHAAGILHRDLKPSNVLLRGVAGELFGYLCDFGIAQGTGPGLTNPGLTHAGAVAGTFAYLAPERLRGEPATPAADLYALGCVLWTCLTGRTPYGGSDVEIGISHLNAPVPRMQPSSPVAEAVNAFMVRAMAKEPSMRHRDADSLRAQLLDLASVARATPHPPLSPEGPTGASPQQHAPGAPPPYQAPSLAPPGSPGSAPPPFTRPPVPSYAGPPPSWSVHGPSPGPRHSRGPVLAAVGAVLAIVVVAGGAAVALRGDGDEGTDEAGGSSSTASSATQSVSSASVEPSTVTPPPSPTYTPPPSPRPDPEPQPFYPDVPAASGPRIQFGAASLSAPASWGTIDPGIVQDGVGARDYSDYEGYYSSVFIRRSEPLLPLDSIELLEVAIKESVRSLGSNDEGLRFDGSELMRPAWLDGERAARIRATYYSNPDDLSFVEEVWLVQHGRFLYRVTFQFSKIDPLAEQRAQIDAMVVSFRWR